MKIYGVSENGWLLSRTGLAIHVGTRFGIKKSKLLLFGKFVRVSSYSPVLVAWMLTEVQRRRTTPLLLHIFNIEQFTNYDAAEVFRNPYVQIKRD